MRRSDFIRGLGLSWLAYLWAPAAVRAARAASAKTIPKPAAPWDAVEFEFEKNGETYPGFAVRLPGQDGKPGEVFSVCRICPHEKCVFGYEKNYELVGRMVGTTLENPVFFCRCHMSVYDPAQAGKVLSGPAKRAPWRFTLEEKDGDLIVASLEEGVGEIK